MTTTAKTNDNDNDNNKTTAIAQPSELKGWHLRHRSQATVKSVTRSPSVGSPSSPSTNEFANPNANIIVNTIVIEHNYHHYRNSGTTPATPITSLPPRTQITILHFHQLQCH